MLNCRSVLGLLAALSVPSRLLADGSKYDLRPGLAKRFADDGTACVFAASENPASGTEVLVSDSARALEGILPASTFKIPHSIIALETGVVADPDGDVFKWDGVERSIPEWNRDHTLRSAIAVSAVPVYREIARRIGPEPMKEFVQKLAYGNGDIGGAPVDAFWLRGNLRVSPVQQLQFIGQLLRGKLPVSQRSQEIVRDILPLTKVGSAVIRAKTGLVGGDSPAADAKVGWLVGWAEKGSTQTAFALNLDIREPRHIASRMKLAQLLLADTGAI